MVDVIFWQDDPWWVRRFRNVGIKKSLVSLKHSVNIQCP